MTTTAAFHTPIGEFRGWWPVKVRSSTRQWSPGCLDVLVSPMFWLCGTISENVAHLIALQVGPRSDASQPNYIGSSSREWRQATGEEDGAWGGDTQWGSGTRNSPSDSWWFQRHGQLVCAAYSVVLLGRACPRSNRLDPDAKSSMGQAHSSQTPLTRFQTWPYNLPSINFPAEGSLFDAQPARLICSKIHPNR